MTTAFDNNILVGGRKTVAMMGPLQGQSSQERRGLETAEGAANLAANSLLEMMTQTATTTSTSEGLLALQHSSRNDQTFLLPNAIYEMGNCEPMMFDPTYYGAAAGEEEMAGMGRAGDVEEQSFCSDFFCCGVYLADLHALLQHYEESHVKVEEEVMDTAALYGNPGGGGNIANFGVGGIHCELSGALLLCDRSGKSIVQGQQYSSALEGGRRIEGLDRTDQSASPTFISNNGHCLYHGPNADCHCIMGDPTTSTKRRRILAVGIEPQDYAVGSGPDAPLSAFDTTVFRTISPAKYGSSTSTPFYPPWSGGGLTLAPSAFKTSASSNNNANDNINSATLVKRSRSAPAHSLAYDPQAINTLRAILPPVLANAPNDNQFKLIYSALSSTVNPPNIAPLSGHTSSSTTAHHHAVRHTSTIKHDPQNKSSSSSSKRHVSHENPIDSQPHQGHHKSRREEDKPERPYMCTVAGCGKTYKNANGLKYHTLHGHDHDGKDLARKPHCCPYPGCAKRYKNSNGLKYHVQHGHFGQSLPTTLRLSKGLNITPLIASLQSIAELNKIEAALKREQALRAQQLLQDQSPSLFSPTSPTITPTPAFIDHFPEEEEEEEEGEGLLMPNIGPIHNRL